jgi:hypothetical protein
MQSDVIEQFGPTSDFKVTNFNQNKNLQIFMLNSSGSGKSYLRILKQGLKVIEKKKAKCLTPQSMWSVKGTDND